MANSLIGSICLESLFDGLTGRGQDGSLWVNLSSLVNGPFQVSQKNGKHYVNIAVWINDEPDEFQNNASIQLNLPKEQRASGAKGKYIGNMKYMQQQQHAPYNPNPQYGVPQGWGQQPPAGPPPNPVPNYGNAFPPPPPAPGGWPAQQPTGPVPPPAPNYGPQQVRQQDIPNMNRQQPPAQQPGGWTPAVTGPVGDLPF